jgi:hypothetical protein
VAPDRLAAALDLQALDARRYHVEASCAVTGVGLAAGMNWLSEAVAHKKPK